VFSDATGNFPPVLPCPNYVHEMSKLLTIKELQTRWRRSYWAARRILFEEQVPVIVLSGYRIRETEICKLEERLCHLKPKE
jgi:hypothetical protein